MLNQVIEGDCLEVMKAIPDKSVNLIVIDPPYNIGKDKRWDKWKTVGAYVEWMGQVFLECQRVLKENGSFYFFHNDFLQIVELQNWLNKNTEFVFKQLIVWDKYNGTTPGTPGRTADFAGQKNYAKCAEYCLFYTFQDQTGLTTIMLDVNNFSTLRRYFKEFQESLGMTKKEILDAVGQRADHCFRWGSSQWDMPTPETYAETCALLPDSSEFIPREYESLREEYESLREEYESLRYVFNSQSLPSVWQHEPIKQNGHITPKPLSIIEKIIRTSSNEGDIVLDCFAGSGTTAIAAINTGRNYICIEKEPEYVQIAHKRVEEAMDKC